MNGSFGKRGQRVPAERALPDLVDVHVLQLGWIQVAAIPVDDPSVEGLHARIIRQVDGSYLIRDQGSKAGTWIQYQEIPPAGQKLSHGDIVHFGRSGYRFVFADPPPAKEIRITRAGEQDDTPEGPTS